MELQWIMSLLLVLLFQICVDVEASRADPGRVSIGGRETLFTLNQTLKIHAIQEDKWLGDGRMLAAIGNAICSIDIQGIVTILAGDFTKAGFVQGNFRTRFNQTSGFAQQENGLVMISDQNNRCIRYLDRNDNDLVYTYAGVCKQNKSDDYQPWKTFNSPSTLQYDSIDRNVYLSDIVNNSPAVISHNLDSKVSHIVNNIHPKGTNNFFYDSFSSFFYVTESTGLFKVYPSGDRERIDFYNIYNPTGLAVQDNIVIVTQSSDDNAAIFDVRYGYKLLEPFCFTTLFSNKISGRRPYCGMLSQPTTVAATDEYIYIATVNLHSIPGISIFRYALATDMAPLTTTTIDPVFPIFTTSWPDDDDYDSYGLSGGSIAAVSGASFCVFVIAFGALLGWRKRRGVYRRRLRQGATVVAVTSTSRSVRGSHAYFRLGDGGGSSGSHSFPPPPVYSQHGTPSAQPNDCEAPPPYTPASTDNSRQTTTPDQ